jgi:hypothetical protein
VNTWTICIFQERVGYITEDMFNKGLDKMWEKPPSREEKASYWKEVNLTRIERTRILQSCKWKVVVYSLIFTSAQN